MAQGPKRFITAADAQHLDEPWCHVEKLCDPQSVVAEHLLLVRVVMPPGQAHNFHRHPGREEIIYVLEEQAEQWVGREMRSLGRGELAHIPCNVPHATFNVGRVPLHFLAILSPVDAAGPATIDVFDEEPWASVRPPISYPDYVPIRESSANSSESDNA